MFDVQEEGKPKQMTLFKSWKRKGESEFCIFEEFNLDVLNVRSFNGIKLYDGDVDEWEREEIRSNGMRAANGRVLVGYIVKAGSIIFPSLEGDGV